MLPPNPPAPQSMRPAEAAQSQPEPALGSIDRWAMTTKERIVALSRPGPRRVAWILAADLGLIVAAAWLCELFFSPAAYILAVMVIGARQAGIGTIVLHDGAHGYVHPRRKVNDAISVALTSALLVVVVGAGFHRYRATHVNHHRYTNTYDDPDFRACSYFYTLTRAERVRLLLSALCGLLFLRGCVQYLAAASMPRRALVVAVAAALAAGCWFGFRPAQLVALYWVLPLATWGISVNLVRRVCEHYPVFDPQRAHMPRVLFTRDVLPSWFDALFVTTRGVNYHWTHHIFPSVPFFNLKTLQAELAATAGYREQAHATRGYHRALREIYVSAVLPRRPPPGLQAAAANRAPTFQ
ncbi:MAG: fatty acid desaturase family protein [Pseudomonadota bacterium]